MNSTEKEISYNTTNSYSTLNAFTSQTKHVWFVCHGMGYLSTYFLRYFKNLDPTENYIIAPQAPSKFYIQPKNHVGANWLTRVNTQTDNENIMSYFDAVLVAENVSKWPNIIVVGYSQGVSVSMRYLASRQLKCSHLLIMSGGFPVELKPEDFKHLSETQVKLVYGLEDEYLNQKRMEEEFNKVSTCFPQVEIEAFNGKHVVHINSIENLLR
ncbi:MAG: esterase [Bacteroidetes bacterium MedPE-SWsnd-G2]|nr:MAG: esterase [Bacteroidetes bacterium MedPE-SWsnd-G2]